MSLEYSLELYVFLPRPYAYRSKDSFTMLSECFSCSVLVSSRLPKIAMSRNLERLREFWIAGIPQENFYLTIIFFCYWSWFHLHESQKSVWSNTIPHSTIYLGCVNLVIPSRNDCNNLNPDRAGHLRFDSLLGSDGFLGSVEIVLFRFQHGTL